MQIDFVISAIITMIKIRANTPQTKELFKGLIKRNESRLNDMTLSFLYNAYIDTNADDCKLPGVKLYADSGGLQLAMLDESKHDIMKAIESIWKNQAQHSDYAFNMDKMPIDIVRSDGFDGSAKLLVGLKRFIKDDINQKALESAELLKRQIDYFQKVGSKSKIFMIVQGNCLNTVNQYANVMLKNLSDSEIEQIHGIAVSGACFGNGDLDKWNILMNLRNIDIPGTLKRNIHLLGITSYKAISPLFLFKNYWNFNDVISIDSTSYTRRYLIDGEIAPLAKIDKSKSLKEQEEFYIKIYKDIEEFIKPLGYDYQKMLDHATYYSRHNVNNIWAYIKRDEKYAQEVSSMFAIQSTCYFIQEFNEKLHALYKEEHPMFYDEIRTYNDWLKFKIHFVRTFGLKSNAVKSSSRKDFELESKIKDLW